MDAAVPFAGATLPLVDILLPVLHARLIAGANTANVGHGCPFLLIAALLGAIDPMCARKAGCNAAIYERNAAFDARDAPISGRSADVFGGGGLQLQVLFSRAKSNALRNRMILRAKLGQGIFMGLLVGLVYLDLGTNQKAIQVPALDLARIPQT